MGTCVLPATEKPTKAFTVPPQKAPIFILQDGDDRAAQPGRGHPPAQELPQVGQQGDGGGGDPGEEDGDDDDDDDD